MVSAFFGNNRNYYDMKLTGDLSNRVSPLDFHSDSIRTICSPSTPVSYDQRAASIELHVESEIELTPDRVLAVVGPDTAMEEPEVAEFCTRMEADAIAYTLEVESVEARQRQIKDATKGWIESKGFFA